ncbi:MAG TPA: universal stress protein [Candidatus Tectomicrobia bacterium]|nr:universal stress protein [Candidatus Tectomicrobia bacterium]
MSKRVLHPTDFSRASRAAFDLAVRSAREDRGQLTLVHVLSPVIPLAGDGYISPAVYDEMEKASRQWAQKKLDALLAQARKAGVKATGMLLDGVAHEQIVRTAKSRRADLIVMGTHGRTGVARFFLGSVAARVAATAPCPVLTVRGK